MITRIAPLDLSHCQAIAAIHATHFDEVWSKDDFEGLLAQDHVWGFGIMIADQIAAFILCQDCAEDIEILTIATSKEFSRQGFAQKLIGSIDNRESQSARTGDWFLEVATDNERALNFYAKLGFETVGKRPKYYRRTNGQFADAIIQKNSIGKIRLT